MEAKRYIGIDLHRDCFTACVRLENGREYLKRWKLEDMPRFADKLRPTDEVAVEMTGNTRLFHDQVARLVDRVVAVNPTQFQGDHAFGEENRSERCPAAGAVPGQGFAAGGADEK